MRRHHTTRNSPIKTHRTTPHHQVQVTPYQSDRNRRPQHSKQPTKRVTSGRQRKERTTRHTPTQQSNQRRQTLQQLTTTQAIKQAHQARLHRPSCLATTTKQIKLPRPTPPMHRRSLQTSTQPIPNHAPTQPFINQSRTSLHNRTERPTTRHSKYRRANHIVEMTPISY